jgi:hypothetical protein
MQGFERENAMSERGSTRLREAWAQKGFQLNDESVGEIVEQLDDSPATVDDVVFHGGAEPTGVSVGLTYADDDVPICGNDLTFWLKWHIHHGVTIDQVPHIIINGRPHPEFVKLNLGFGAGMPSEQRGV